MRLGDLTDQGSPRPPSNWRRGFALLVSAALLGLILWRIHPERLGRVLSQLQPMPAFAALLCVISAALLLAIRWRWMLQIQGFDDGFLAAWRGVLVGNALSAALLGAVLGDVAKSAWYSRRHGHAFGGVLLACGLDRLCGGFGLAVYAAATLVLAVLGGARLPVQMEWNPNMLRALVWIIGVAGLIGALLFFRFRVHLLEHRQEVHRRVGEAWQLLRMHPGLLVAAMGVSFLAHLLIGATLGCALAAVSPTGLPWFALLWTFPAISLAAAMPFTFAGAGAREGAALAIWSWFGIPGPVAVAASLITFLATLLGAIPGSLLFLQGARKPC